MLTATTTTFQNAITLGITINYPEIAKRKPENMLVASVSHAQKVINNKTRDFVFETIATFVKHRKNCLSAYPSSRDYKNQIRIIEVITSVLCDQKDTKLEVLTGIISQLEKEIRFIRPHSTSPFRRKFDNVILPVVLWCKEFSAPAMRKPQAA